MPLYLLKKTERHADSNSIAFGKASRERSEKNQKMDFDFFLITNETI